MSRAELMIDLDSDDDDDRRKEALNQLSRRGSSIGLMGSKDIFKKVMKTPIKMAKKTVKDALGQSNHGSSKPKKIKDALAVPEIFDVSDDTPPAQAEAATTAPQEPIDQSNNNNESGPPVTRVGRSRGKSRDSIARSRSQSRQRPRRHNSGASIESGHQRGSSVHKPRRGGRRTSAVGNAGNNMNGETNTRAPRSDSNLRGSTGSGANAMKRAVSSDAFRRSASGRNLLADAQAAPEASNRSKSKRSANNSGEKSTGKGGGETKERGRRPPERTSSGYSTARGKSVDGRSNNRGRGRSQSVARGSRARSSSRARAANKNSNNSSSPKQPVDEAPKKPSFASMALEKAREAVENKSQAAAAENGLLSPKTPKTPGGTAKRFSVSRSGSARDLLARAADVLAEPRRSGSNRNLMGTQNSSKNTLTRQGSSKALPRANSRSKLMIDPAAETKTTTTPKKDPSWGTDATVQSSDHSQSYNFAKFDNDDEEEEEDAEMDDEIDDSEGEDAPASVAIDPKLLAKAREVERRLAREKAISGGGSKHGGKNSNHSNSTFTSLFSTASSTSGSQNSTPDPSPTNKTNNNNNSTSHGSSLPRVTHRPGASRSNRNVGSTSNRNPLGSASNRKVGSTSNRNMGSTSNRKTPSKVTALSTGNTGSTWTCPCGEHNKDEFNFCGLCGSKRAVTPPSKWECGSCGRGDNEPRFRFCVGCGTPKQ